MNKSTQIVSGLATIILLTLAVSAGAQSTSGADISAFRLYKDVGPFNIKVPTVVEIPLENDWRTWSQFLVLENASGQYIASMEKTHATASPIPVQLRTQGGLGQSSNLTDGRLDTHVEFALPETGRGVAEMVLTGASPITSSALTVLLDNNVALPDTIEIRTLDDAGKIVLAKTKMEKPTVVFLKTTALKWQIRLEYVQPLRIAELNLRQDDLVANVRNGLRFLAQAGSSYRIYLDPDRIVRASVNEQPRLSDDRGVLEVPTAPSVNNPEYRESDMDADSILDRSDNCISRPNTDQLDIDANGRGDACDDFDRDGRMNSEDNCIERPNSTQTDTDNDGIGDECDGEESRITEQLPWLPWAGMGLAAVVILGLFARMLMGSKDRSGGNPAPKP